MKFTNEIKREIVQLIADKKEYTLYAYLSDLLGEIEGPGNRKEIKRFMDFLVTREPVYSIFAKTGNVKLPFLSFSSLPGAPFCVGAGDCLEWCYSFKAWRYAAAFFRQCQNTMLLQTEKGREFILSELDSFDSGAPIDFRLYVDGDFSTIDEVSFWMDSLNDRPWLKTYGYSKSWELFIEYEKSGKSFPENYKLNLSSGSKYGQKEKESMKLLSITRGEFIAVSIGKKVSSSDHGTQTTNKALRAAHDKKAFTCPGSCGTCTPKGHACGSSRFNDIDIIIAVH